jgi:hypothetical protein
MTKLAEPRTWEDIVLDGCEAAKQVDGGQWRLGDLALEVDTTKSYGEGRLSRFAERIGVAPDRLRKLKVVARRFPEEVRAAHILPFAHFEEVYTRAAAEKWLRLAQRKHWSRDRMREEIWKEYAAYEASRPHMPSTEAGDEQWMLDDLLPKETEEQRRARAADYAREYCRDGVAHVDVYDEDGHLLAHPDGIERACLWIASGPDPADPEWVSADDVTHDDWLALRVDLEKLLAAIDERLRRMAAA